MNSELSNKILQEVKENYNLIARDYARTREFISPDVKEIVAKYVLKQGKILDSGCGNGRLFELLNALGREYIGLDASEELLKIAKQNYPSGNFIAGDALKLTFTDNSFDQIFSMSVLHHFPGQTRQKYLQECFRILKPGGSLILRVWNMWHNDFAKQLMIKFTVGKLLRKNDLDFMDIYYPWKDGQGNVVAKRYLHCFTQSELEGLFKRTGFVIKESWSESKGVNSNIYIVAQKP